MKTTKKMKTVKKARKRKRKKKQIMMKVKWLRMMKKKHPMKETTIYHSLEQLILQVKETKI